MHTPVQKINNRILEYSRTVKNITALGGLYFCDSVKNPPNWGDFYWTAWYVVEPTLTFNAPDDWPVAKLP